MSQLSMLMRTAQDIERKTREQNERKQIEKLEHRSDSQLASLSDHFRIKVQQVLSDLRSKGFRPVVFWGVRTAEQQKELHAKGVGAEKSLHVHGTTKIVQRAGWTYLQTGEAADIVDARYLWSGPAADLSHDFWKSLGAAAEARGLEWGGRWPNRDVAHIQCAHHEWHPRKKDFKKHMRRDDTPMRYSTTLVA